MAERSDQHDRTLTTRDAAIIACVTSAVVHAALVPDHVTEEPLIGSLFCAAAAALVVAAVALARPALRPAPVAAAAVFAALLVAYPVTLVVQGDGIDALGVGTKAVELIGLGAAVRSRGHVESSASVDVLAGVVVALLLLSLGHSH